MTHARLAAVFLAVTTLSAQAATAQHEQPETVTATDDLTGDEDTSAGIEVAGQPQHNGPSVTLRSSARLQFDADFHGEPGDFGVNRALLGVAVAGRINDATSYSLDFEIENSAYDFSGATTLVPGTEDPLDDALSFVFMPSFRVAIDDAWAIRAGGALIVSGETDANVSDSLRGSLFGGVERRLSDRLTLSLLVVGWTRLEDDAQFFPLIGVSWQINDLMRLQTRGLGAEFISDLGNGWSLGARAAYEYREFRLSDDSSAPLPEGVLRDSGVVTSLELAWTQSPGVVFAIEGGGVFTQELEFLDRAGSTVSSTNTNTALFIGVRASFAF